MPMYLQLIGTLFLVAFMLSLGLETPLADLKAVLRRPGRLLWAVVVAVVLVPLATVLPVLSMELSRPLVVAVVLLAVAPGAPFVPLAARVSHGSVAFATALRITLGAVTVVTAPLSARYFLGSATQTEIDATRSIVTLLAFQVLPLAIGLFVRRRSENAAASADRIAKAVYLVALAVLLALLVAPRLSALESLGFRGLGVTLFAAVATWMIGWLGGYDASSRRTAMIVCGAPNVGLALAISQAAGLAPIFAATLTGMWLVRIVLNAALAGLIGKMTGQPRTSVTSEASVRTPSLHSR
jgi:BASS family bile acid:Na+ symporter